jgi:hypothetical protein
MSMQKFNFEFTEAEVNIILVGLGKLPTEQSYNMINKIQVLASEQQTKVKAEVSKVEKDAK